MREDKTKKKSKIKLYLIVVTRQNNCFYIMFSYNEQDKIKY